jgi:hypothetical protein
MKILQIILSHTNNTSESKIKVFLLQNLKPRVGLNFFTKLKPLLCCQYCYLVNAFRLSNALAQAAVIVS